LIKKNLAKLNYSHPTPVQEQCLEPAMEGKDILGIAGTGTGKTAAFLLPIIAQLLVDDTGNRALVVVPTRELALQVTTEFNQLSAGSNLKSVCFIGGTNGGADLKKLRQQYHLVIGTPGRLLDLYQQKALNLSAYSTLVLDEFDRMLDMGFLQDVRKLLHGLSNRQQTMFFSATIEKSHRALIEELLKDPVQVRISQGTHASDRVNQEIVKLEAGSDKFEMLLNLIQNQDFSKVLIFAETKRMVDKVGKQLNKSGIRSDVIHGNKSQNYRIKALHKFSKGKVQVLVATDVAARGLDVDDISHVINYQVPRTMDAYIHRIGRTGRAGRSGKAITFVD
jgi:ATP-dependent RNA helicase RhlE